MMDRRDEHTRAVRIWANVLNWAILLSVAALVGIAIWAWRA